MLTRTSSISRKLVSIRKLLMAAMTVALLAASPADAGVEGPIAGAPTLLGTTSFNLADVGYQQNEFFVSGSANSYTNTKPLTTDGKWSVKAAIATLFLLIVFHLFGNAL